MERLNFDVMYEIIDMYMRLAIKDATINNVVRCWNQGISHWNACFPGNTAMPLYIGSQRRRATSGVGTPPLILVVLTLKNTQIPPLSGLLMRAYTRARDMFSDNVPSTSGYFREVLGCPEDRTIHTDTPPSDTVLLRTNHCITCPTGFTIVSSTVATLQIYNLPVKYIHLIPDKLVRGIDTRDRLVQFGKMLCNHKLHAAKLHVRFIGAWCRKSAIRLHAHEENKYRLRSASTKFASRQQLETETKRMLHAHGFVFGNQGSWTSELFREHHCGSKDRLRAFTAAVAVKVTRWPDFRIKL